MPDIIIVAGPNGAGKTSFARQFLAQRVRPIAYLNADEIARDLPAIAGPAWRRDIEAARMMLTRMDELAGTGSDFAVETTLSALAYVEKIKTWQRLGYQVALIFLRLPSPEHAIERVRRRVHAGGHGIPEDTICRRFSQGLNYLEKYYKPIVNVWYVYDSSEGSITLAASSEGTAS